MVQILIVEDDEQVRVLAKAFSRKPATKLFPPVPLIKPLLSLRKAKKSMSSLPTLPSNPTPTPDWCWRKKQ